MNGTQSPQTKTPMQKHNFWKPKPRDGIGFHEKQFHPTAISNETRTPQQVVFSAVKPSGIIKGG